MKSSAASRLGNAAPKKSMPTQKGRKRFVSLIEKYGGQLTFRELETAYKKQYTNSLDDYEIRLLFGLEKDEQFDEFELFRERLSGYVDVSINNGDMLFVMIEDDEFQDYGDLEVMHTGKGQQQSAADMSEREVPCYSGVGDQHVANGYDINLAPPPVLAAPRANVSYAVAAADPGAFNNNPPTDRISEEITASGSTHETSVSLPIAKNRSLPKKQEKMDLANIIFSLLSEGESGLPARDICESLIFMGLFQDFDAARDAVHMAVFKNPSSFYWQKGPEGLFLHKSGTPPVIDAKQNQAGDTASGSPTIDQKASGGEDSIPEVLDSETGAVMKIENAVFRSRPPENYGPFVRVENHILHDYSGHPDGEFLKIDLENLMVIETKGRLCRMLVDFSMSGIGEDGDDREKLQNELFTRFAHCTTGGDLRKIYFAKVGEHCVTFDMNTTRYFRAEVLKYVPAGCDVRLIDFRQDWRVEVDSLRSLPADLAKVPAFGLQLFTPLFAIIRGKEEDFWDLFGKIYSKCVVKPANVFAKICRKKPEEPLEIFELRVDLHDERFSVFSKFVEEQMIHFI